jgi:GDP-mannose 4,6-dehydratase
MKTIPYGRQYIDRQDIRLVSKALKEDLITTGRYVKKFEAKISRFLKVKYAVSCSSGTSALHLALMGIGLERDDVVIMPAINFIAVYNMAMLMNAKIFLADVDPLTGQMTPETLLECIKNINPAIKYYQAGSSEIYGNLSNITITEETLPYPKTPYGVAKLYAQWIIRNYRESSGLFACNGISFNHESERRGLQFVTKKITSGVAGIAKGEINSIELGNLDITRDWGYTLDFVEAMWLMLQNDTPEDFIIATNQSHSLRYLLEVAFKAVGITDYSSYITINPKFIRSNDIQGIKGDYSKINNHLGWAPKTSFEEMITRMVNHDLNK